MKRKHWCVLSLALMVLVMLSGCSGMDLDKEWWKKINEMHKSKVSDAYEYAKVYADGIRGGASYNASSNGDVQFSYIVTDENKITLTVNSVNETGHFDIYVTEENDSFYTDGNEIPFSELSSYINDVINGKENYSVSHREAMENYPERVKSDLKILYARFLVLWNREFSEVLPLLKSDGIDLGNSYPGVDPTEALSGEIVIENEHNFVNGVCQDCGTTWTRYMNKTLAAFNGAEVSDTAKKTKWFSHYGQKSSDCGIYVQYSSDNTSKVELYLLDENNNPNQDCEITVRQEEECPTVSINFCYEECPYNTDNGMVAYKYRYSIQTSTDVEKLSELLSSKEAFKEFSIEMLLTTDENRVLTDLWDEKSDEENLKLLKSDNAKYFTKEEFLDFFWNERTRMLTALDKGMVWYDTSLKDLGLNYGQ